MTVEQNSWKTSSWDELSLASFFFFYFDRSSKYLNAIIQMQFHINHVWTNAPVLTHVSDPQWKVAASRSNFCLIPAFRLGDTLRGDGSPSQWGRTAMVAGGTEGAKLWTTCFHHLGHILHDGAKRWSLDSHHNTQRTRLDTNVHVWQEWRLKLASPTLRLLLSSLCPYVNKLF